MPFEQNTEQPQATNSSSIPKIILGFWQQKFVYILAFRQYTAWTQFELYTVLR